MKSAITINKITIMNEIEKQNSLHNFKLNTKQKKILYEQIKKDFPNKLESYIEYKTYNFISQKYQIQL